MANSFKEFKSKKKDAVEDDKDKAAPDQETKKSEHVPAKKDSEEDKKTVPEKAKNKVDTKPTITEEELAEALEYIMEGDISDIADHQETLVAFKEDFNVAQRMHKGLVMKRYRAKIGNARRRSEQHRADQSVIKKRAKRRAINSTKERLLRGVNIADATASTKNRIENKIKKRKANINRLALRMVQDVRATEKSRLSNKNEGTEVSDEKTLVENFNKVFTALNT